MNKFSRAQLSARIHSGENNITFSHSVQLNFVPNKGLLVLFHFSYRNVFLFLFIFCLQSPFMTKNNKTKRPKPKQNFFFFFHYYEVNMKKMIFCFSFFFFLLFQLLTRKLKENLTNFNNIT